MGGGGGGEGMASNNIPSLLSKKIWGKIGKFRGKGVKSRERKKERKKSGKKKNQEKIRKNWETNLNQVIIRPDFECI